MTRPAHSPLHPSKLRQMARLHQLHFETHPKRVAALYGVTEAYVRMCWSRLHDEMVPTEEALDALRQAK